MKTALDLLRTVAGLFFDDGSLATAVLGILAVTALLVSAAWLEGPAAIAFVVSAVTAALLENVIRTARAMPPGERSRSFRSQRIAPDLKR